MLGRLPVAFFPALLASAALAGACSSDTGENDDGLPSGTGATSGSSNDAGSSGSGNATGGTQGSGAANGSGGNRPIGTGGTIIVEVGGTSGTSGNGMPEVCDGVDNDENGITDDVDAGGDGVCDCLSIGTIGHIGPWSNGGNIFETWLNARTPQGAVALGDQELTAERLAALQVIVVLHAGTLEIVDNEGETTPANHAFSEAETAAFAAWIENGGGVMTTIGYSHDEAAEVENVNRLLAPVGMGYSTSRLDLTDFISDWDEHPVTTGVTNIFTDNGVEPEGDGTTVARGNDDGAALQVLETGNGHVVVWGDEWITYDSEWEDVEGQQVELFWLNILKWLSPEKVCQVPIPPDIVR
jgi:hypothetical protein